MPVFHFDLVGPDGLERDCAGIEFRDLDAAYMGAVKAIAGISADLLGERKDAGRYHFELRDPGGVLLLELPFAEVLGRRSAAALTDHLIFRERLQQTLLRGRTLKKELAAGLLEARAAVETARATLRRARGRPFNRD